MLLLSFLVFIFPLVQAADWLSTVITEITTITDTIQISKTITSVSTFSTCPLELLILLPLTPTPYGALFLNNTVICAAQSQPSLTSLPTSLPPLGTAATQWSWWCQSNILILTLLLTRSRHRRCLHDDDLDIFGAYGICELGYTSKT